jgi:hypothetical protein
MTGARKYDPRIGDHDRIEWAGSMNTPRDNEMPPVVKIDFTHSDGDGVILMRLLHADGEESGLRAISREMAMDAMMELAEAIRDEFGPFGGIKSYGQEV